MKYPWIDEYLLAKPDGDVPDELLKKLLDHAYDVVFKSLTKKKQKEISAGGVSARPGE